MMDQYNKINLKTRLLCTPQKSVIQLSHLLWGGPLVYVAIESLSVKLVSKTLTQKFHFLKINHG